MAVAGYALLMRGNGNDWENRPSTAMQMQDGASKRERSDEHAEAGQFTTCRCTSMGRAESAYQGNMSGETR